MIDWLVESFLIWGSRWLCWLDFLGSIKDIKQWILIKLGNLLPSLSIKEWRTTYDNKNIHVYWWTKLFMMSICMAILYALGLKLDIWKYKIFWKWPNEYVLVPRLTQAWTGTRTRLYALTWAWSAQPGRGVTRTWEIPLLIWSTRDVVTHWTC